MFSAEALLTPHAAGRCRVFHFEYMHVSLLVRAGGEAHPPWTHRHRREVVRVRSGLQTGVNVATYFLFCMIFFIVQNKYPIDFESTLWSIFVAYPQKFS